LFNGLDEINLKPTDGDSPLFFQERQDKSDDRRDL